jgi:uncharacterized membrane protein
MAFVQSRGAAAMALKTKSWIRAGAAALLLCGMTPTVAPAQTEHPDRVAINYCNKSANPVYLAVTYHDWDRERAWISVGWFPIAAGKCQVLNSGNDSVSFYYAEDRLGKVWGGDEYICVGPAEGFEWDDYDDSDCTGRAAPARRLDVKGQLAMLVELVG